MAKTSQVARNQKRMRKVAHFAARRKELKTLIKKSTNPEEIAEACAALSALPRDASPTRVRGRCELTGRARGYISYFGLCRNEFRRLAHFGQLPGVKKSSW